MTDRDLVPLIRLAPAKVNLTLSIGPRRPDGYHALHSVMVPLAMSDRLSVARAHGPDDSLHVTGEDGPPRADDLVLRGIAAARRGVGRSVGRDVEAFPLAARLEKRLPLAAGLGGGSSDAAAAIEAALAAWGVELDLAERISIAADVGSDVPFFLAGGPALVEGRGERVTPLAQPTGRPIGLLIVTPALALSTTEAFRLLDAGGPGAPADPQSTRLTSEHLAAELRAGLAGASLVARAGVLAAANDLMNAATALAPDLRAFRRSLVRQLGRPVGQSGSGPTMWALYASLEDAESAAQRLREAVAAGELVGPGAHPPRIEATTMAGRSER
jgi:4-diphosphocytidyl-2-C-methyl-D-erythritol kinase